MPKVSVAYRITRSMATWRFMGVFLAGCLAEIAWNHTSWAARHHLNFDPTTIILNLFLSLVAAVQGSVIMIAQNQAAQTEEAKQERERAQILAILALAEAHDDEIPLIRQIAANQIIILELLKREADAENTRKASTPQSR